MLIDTRVHLGDEWYGGDLSEVITRAREAGVSHMFVIGSNRSTVECAMRLIDEYDFLCDVIGRHPAGAIDFIEEHLEWIESLAQHPRMIDVSEMGLDYHWGKSPADVQKEVSRKQITLAKHLKLPIIIHNHEAAQDCIDILLEEHAEEVGGIIHSFSGSPEITDVATNKLNSYISLDGPVTFKNAKQPKKVAKHVLMERLLVETDAPYLLPHPYRGKRNKPAGVTLVTEQVAELKGLPYEEMCEQATKNAEESFSLNS